MNRKKSPTPWPSRVKNKIYKEMLEHIDCGPIDGGCYLMASAMEQVFDGRLEVIVDSEDRAEHAVLSLTGGAYLDGDGLHESQASLLRWFGEQEGLISPLSLRPIQEGDLEKARERASPEVTQIMTRVIKEAPWPKVEAYRRSSPLKRPGMKP